MADPDTRGPDEQREHDLHAPAAPGHVAENHLEHVGKPVSDPEAWTQPALPGTEEDAGGDTRG